MSSRSFTSSLPYYSIEYVPEYRDGERNFFSIFFMTHFRLVLPPDVFQSVTATTIFNSTRLIKCYFRIFCHTHHFIDPRWTDVQNINTPWRISPQTTRLFGAFFELHRIKIIIYTNVKIV